MRTHISIKTWLLQRNGNDIGTIRGTETRFTSAQSIEHIIGEKAETLYIVNVIPEQLVIVVR